jgi:hypothetical protein
VVVGLWDQKEDKKGGVSCMCNGQGHVCDGVMTNFACPFVCFALCAAAGDADAYGTIADCYTDLDQFEQAASYYDKYIQCMNRDGPV